MENENNTEEQEKNNLEDTKITESIETIKMNQRIYLL